MADKQLTREEIIVDRLETLITSIVDYHLAVQGVTGRYPDAAKRVVQQSKQALVLTLKEK